MKLFRASIQTQSAKSRRIYAAFEILDTIIAFLAALSFLVGSVLFLWKEYEITAAWFFIIGSLFFCLKPTMRLLREIRLASLGDAKDLADRFDI